MVGDILIRVLHIFVSTGYPISHKIIQICPFMQTALALQNYANSFFLARTQSPEISHIGAIWIPYFFQTKTGISVTFMITMFSIMSGIFKTWTMINDVQANLLVDQKVIKGA